MANTHFQKIASRESLDPGKTSKLRWNNPPWGKVFGYFAYPVPPPASGEHGTRTGTVEITKVSCTHFRDNDSEDKQYVYVHVKNSGDEATGYDLYQGWVSD